MARRCDPFQAIRRGGRVGGACPRRREACSRSTAQLRSTRGPARAARPARWTSVFSTRPGRGRAPHGSAADDPSSGACGTGLADLFGELPRVDEGRSSSGGSALVAHDGSGTPTSKRLALAAADTARRRTSASSRARVARSSGCCSWTGRCSTATSERAPVDRSLHRLLDPLAPLWLAGDALRETFAGLARQPFRTRYLFPGPGAVIGCSASSAWARRTEPRLVVRAHRTRGDAARRRA